MEIYVETEGDRSDLYNEAVQLRRFVVLILLGIMGIVLLKRKNKVLKN